MNIVYLIGNGFDVNLGLKTEYSHFYNYYLGLESPNENVAKLKKAISKYEGTELWKDLEIALGQITAEYENAYDFIEALDDISDNLLLYIKSEQERIYTYEQGSTVFIRDIAHPTLHIPNAAKVRVKTFLEKWATSHWKTDIITFNYTNILDGLTRINIGQDIGPHHLIYPNKLSSITHVHGRYDDTILLGVDNVEQIANEHFRTNEDLLEIFVKPVANKAMDMLIDETCANLINNASLIVTFGLSFGPTDKIWWERIKDRLKTQNSRMIIFDYVKYIDNTPNRKTRTKSYRRKTCNNLFGEDADSLSEYIDYALNTDMFKLKELLQREEHQSTYVLTA